MVSADDFKELVKNTGFYIKESNSGWKRLCVTPMDKDEGGKVISGKCLGVFPINEIDDGDERERFCYTSCQIIRSGFYPGWECGKFSRVYDTKEEIAKALKFQQSEIKKFVKDFRKSKIDEI